MGAGTTGAFAPSALLGVRLASPAANAWASGDGAASLYQTGWAGATTAAKPRSFTIKVLRSSGKTTEIEVDTETDLRTALRAAKVDLYTIRGKMSNCGGNASCGFCVIDVVEGAGNLNGMSMREERLLAKKPDSYRLACQTRINGSVTVRPKP
ncbi:hypothetical protein MMPV_001795 [Pyropia vietnamensis]